jgi:hypothetical protein
MSMKQEAHTVNRWEDVTIRFYIVDLGKMHLSRIVSEGGKTRRTEFDR